MLITKDAIDSGKQKAVEAHIEAPPEIETQTKQVEIANEVESEEPSVSSTTNEHHAKPTKAKVGFFRRIFNKA